MTPPKHDAIGCYADVNDSQLQAAHIAILANKLLDFYILRQEQIILQAINNPTLKISVLGICFRKVSSNSQTNVAFFFVFPNS